MDPQYGRINIIPGISVVVDTITGRSARVEKILNNAVQVTVKQRGYELENWPWSWLTMRQPRLIKRYPRPFRFPREERTEHCHCKIGKMEVRYAEDKKAFVICLRCKNPIGTESFPRRIARAKELVRKDGATKPLSQVRQGVSRPSKGKTPRGSKGSVKARRKSPSKLVVRPTRSNDAKTSNPKTRAKSRALPKRKGRAHPVPKGSNQKVSKVSRGKKKQPIRKPPTHVPNTDSVEEIPLVNQVDVVESVPEPNPAPDVRGPGSGGTADVSEVLPGVPGGTDPVH